MRGTKRQVATLMSRKAVDHKKTNSSRTAAITKRDDDGDDVADSATSAIPAGSKFHNRTLQIFLHEMRAALDQEVVEQGGNSTDISGHLPNF